MAKLIVRGFKCLKKVSDDVSIWEVNKSILLLSEKTGFFCYGFANAYQAQVEGFMNVTHFLTEEEIVYTPHEPRKIAMRDLLRGTGV